VEEDDVSLLLLDFGGSTVAMVDATFCVRATRQRSLAALEIYGADGTIAADIWADSDKLTMWRDEGRLGVRGWTAVETDPAPWDLGSAVDHMVDCILGDRPVIPSGEHARHVLEIMEKAMAAARTGIAQVLETSFERNY
jgi:predicted dehydrogenase